MKLQITFKSPDSVSYALTEAGLDQNHLPPEVKSALKKFVEYQEYVTIEIDTDEMTACVVPVF